MTGQPVGGTAANGDCCASLAPDNLYLPKSRPPSAIPWSLCAIQGPTIVQMTRTLLYTFIFGLFACGAPNSNTEKKLSTARMDSPVNTSSDTTAVGRKLDSFRQVPAFIRTYLDSIEGQKFLIAERGGHWASCGPFLNWPRRKFISAAITDSTFFMSYLQGGQVTVKRFLRASLANHRVQAVEYGF